MLLRNHHTNLCPSLSYDEKSADALLVALAAEEAYLQNHARE